MNSTAIVEISDDEEVPTQNSTEYYSNELKIWIDLDNMVDWALVDFDSNVGLIFNNLRDHFFLKNSIDTKYTALLDINHAIVDESAFKIFERSKKVLLSRSILTRPRIQQVSIILHILIHLYLNKISNGAIGIYKHDDNFRSIMHHLNKILNGNITSCHKFVYEQNESDYPKNWWVCIGGCEHYQPFKGLIRSTIIPNDSMLFWRLHQEKCSATFYKVFEIQKSNSLDEVDKKYIRSIRLANPTPNIDTVQNKVHPAKLPIREKVDLTSDTSSPIVRTLCDVIDLDESQYNMEQEDNPKYFEEYKKFPLISNSCPFCLHIIGSSRLASHFDVCMGHQQEVNHCIRPYIPARWPNPSFYKSIDSE